MQIKQTAKQLAIQTAKTTLRESNEFLKIARQQIAPIPEAPRSAEKPISPKPSESGPKQEPNVDQNKLQVQSNRLKEALDRELEDIRKENIFKDLQKRISEGEELNLENFQELSLDQKQVLYAEMEAVKARKEANTINSKKSSLTEIVGKKGRKMFNVIKGRNEKHVETRQPPSS